MAMRSERAPVGGSGGDAPRGGLSAPRPRTGSGAPPEDISGKMKGRVA